jgi:hypothetical protein
MQFIEEAANIAYRNVLPDKSKTGRYNQANENFILNGVQRKMFLTFVLFCRPEPESFSYLSTDHLLSLSIALSK